MKRLNILVTSAGWKAAQACMRSFSRMGHRVTLISQEIHESVFYSRHCYESFICPDERLLNEYSEFILGLLQKKKYDLLVPINDYSSESISLDRARLSQYVKLMIPPQEQITLGLNKAGTYRWAQDAGISIPRTWFPKSLDDVRRIVSECPFPCVVKMPRASGGMGNSYFDKPEEVVNFFNRNFSNFESGWPVIQEFITGQVCGFQGVMDKGKVLDFFMWDKVRQYPQSGGVSVYARSIRDENLQKFGYKIVETLSWDGAVLMDFVRTSQGKYYLLEINPRFGGTTLFAYTCGIDLPKRFLNLVMGRDEGEPVTAYREGMIFRSIFPVEINSCFANPKYWKPFFFNFLKPGILSDIVLDDPKMLLHQIKDAWWRCMTRNSRLTFLGKYRWPWLVPTLALMGLVLYTSTKHGPDVPGVSQWWEKQIFNFLHIPIYGAMTYGWLRFFRKPGKVQYIFILLFLFGVLNEFVQGMTPGREFSVDDMERNAVGILLVMVFLLLKKLNTKAE